MAGFVLKDARVEINGVDLSDHVRSVSLDYSVDAVENTAMGTSTKTMIAGLGSWSLSVTFNQDFAPGSVDATLWALHGASPFTVRVRPRSAPISETNPEYFGAAILTKYSPISGSPGDNAEVEATFESAGVLTRATS